MQTYRKQRAWRVLGACLLAVLLLFGADAVHNANRLQVDRNDPLRTHLQCQIHRHIVVVTAIDIFFPVDFLCLKCRKAGGRSQQIFPQLSLRDVPLVQLQRL